uniref:Uncharacterized protein n=1 Tax=Melopsittacus undulatus TaxID=13146 RepID=A0A8V5G903_MELUD
MCTTALLLGTLVMILRRRFSNRVEPYVCFPNGVVQHPAAHPAKQPGCLCVLMPELPRRLSSALRVGTSPGCQ